jgi:YVTN family beta-propeller protein
MLIFLVLLVLASALVVPFARAQAVVATPKAGSFPYELAYDSAKGEVFVVNRDSNSLTVISDATNTVVATLTVGSGPEGVAYD